MRSHSDKTGKRDSLQERRAVMVQPRLTTWVEVFLFQIVKVSLSYGFK